MTPMAYELVVIGASWGGLHALSVVLASLPVDFGAAVVIAQHRGTQPSGQLPGAPGGLPHVLDRRSRLPLREARDKDPIVAGCVYLAPSDYHLLVEPGTLSLSTDPREQFSRPSIDVLFESAADAYTTGVVGVVLTGANRDGAIGLRWIRQRGGFAVVEDPSTADKAAMPEAALATAGADEILSLTEIGPCLQRLCGGGVATAGSAT